ncbi:type 3 dihydrofolate reductase [Hymenobacter ginsengisoli]|uniref:Dihydrofolate reductase n=1 Tax=Hymenobacter ginsengisoli TaxID=1051626 RepID=A0ABP8Q621_9BACT|nr:MULTISPECIES: dihydrofolate reductase [unclassified Hymenobacter]MBO2031700.1 dihydrofolate reductase [Hymenobacter sp. BT559]
MVSIIVAAAEDNVIGRQGQLPWHLPADLQHFKKLTLGHPIVMGRRTFESIGRVLPGRTTIVVTGQVAWPAPDGVLLAHSLPEALALAAQQPGGEEVCIIGGGEVYREALAATDQVYLTEVHTTVPDGDTFFPALPPTDWREETRERHAPDAQHALAYSFVTLRRR